jgi:glutathione synthase/RimK-type ligase-like ATP-grasp enzyme
MKKKKKLVVGLITDARRMGTEEKLFIQCAKERGMKLVLINLAKKFSPKEFERQIRRCDILYNDEGADYVMEPLKEAEALGKLVLDPSRIFYYTEDKWMFYIKCKRHGIPTLESTLLPNSLDLAREELKEFNHWPVVLKRIHGMHGIFVQKADNLGEAMKIVKSFWKQDVDLLPIVAQEFVRSYSYRVTTIGDEIVQTAIKKSNRWKCTGYYAKRIDSFRVTPELRRLVRKVIRVMKIKVCGIDLVKKDGQWLVLEVNAEPGLTFVDGKRKTLIGKILDLIKREYRRHRRKSQAKRLKPRGKRGE